MLVVERVTKKFDHTVAVDGISFSVAEGENLVLLGTSGCGKTTTLRMLNQLIPPTSGSIKINGKNVGQEDVVQLRRSIGYVLQNNSLFPHYTVAENIATIPRLLSWDKNRIDKRVNELLKKLHLDPATYLNKYPAQLSGGQQQRVNIARALAADPPLLLMDEPFGSLDTVTRTNIRKEFKELDEFKKKTIVMVTHDVQEAFELGDRVCLMDKGKIMQIGTPGELLNNPANDFVAHFFEEQRLQLKLQTIKLKELWELLPVHDNSTPAMNISADATLWMALQQLDMAKGTGVAVDIEKDGNTKNVSWEGIMMAYNAYKNRRN